MKYIYSAIFEPNESGTKFMASVPDLPGCVSSGRTLQEAIDEIADAASLWLVTAEDKDIPIPPATEQDDLEHLPGYVFSVIQVDTIAYRALTDTRAVRKNVSLPAWMVALADKRGINCSQLLQESLRAKLSTV